MQRVSPLLQLLANEKESSFNHQLFLQLFHTVCFTLGHQHAETLRPAVSRRRFFLNVKSLCSSLLQIFSVWQILRQIPIITRKSTAEECRHEFIGVIEGQVTGGRFHRATETVGASWMGAVLGLLLQYTANPTESFPSTMLLTAHISRGGLHEIPEHTCVGLQLAGTYAFQAATVLQQALGRIVGILMHVIAQSLGRMNVAAAAFWLALRKLGVLCDWLPPLAKAMKLITQLFEALWMVMGRFPTAWHLCNSIECVVPVAAQPQQQPNFTVFGILRVLRVVGQCLVDTPEDKPPMHPRQSCLRPSSTGLTCALCQQTCERPFRTPCMHTFCWTCIARWLSDHTAACPLCRKKCSMFHLSPVSEAPAMPLTNTS